MRRVIVRVSSEVQAKTSKRGNIYKVQQANARMEEDGETILAGRIQLFVRERDGKLMPYPGGLFELPEGWYLAAGAAGLELRSPEFPPESQLKRVDPKRNAETAQ